MVSRARLPWAATRCGGPLPEKEEADVYARRAAISYWRSPGRGIDRIRTPWPPSNEGSYDLQLFRRLGQIDLLESAQTLPIAALRRQRCTGSGRTYSQPRGVQKLCRCLRIQFINSIGTQSRFRRLLAKPTLRGSVGEMGRV